MAEESHPEMPLLRATEEPSSVHSLLMALGKGLFASLPVAGIVVGAMYLGQCPRQPLIPVYLVVLCAVTLLLLFLSCLPCGDGTGHHTGALLSCFRGACLLFLCTWFIAGNIWVYSIYPPDYEAFGQPTFCQRTLFLFAFAITTVVHVSLAVALLLAVCILVGILVFNNILPYGGHGCRGGL